MNNLDLCHLHVELLVACLVAQPSHLQFGCDLLSVDNNRFLGLFAGTFLRGGSLLGSLLTWIS